MIAIPKEMKVLVDKLEKLPSAPATKPDSALFDEVHEAMSMLSGAEGRIDDLVEAIERAEHAQDEMLRATENFTCVHRGLTDYLWKDAGIEVPCTSKDPVTATYRDYDRHIEVSVYLDELKESLLHASDCLYTVNAALRSSESRLRGAELLNPDKYPPIELQGETNDE